MTGFLAQYRVLDLTDERGLVGGRILADLGADVVHVEPLEGSTARSREPVVTDDDGSVRSMEWEAFACRQRGLALDLGSAAGRDLFADLARRADILLESADPGELEALGLGADRLQEINPSLVHVSITPFGDDGPKASYRATDLTVWAAGGALQAHRDGSREPLGMSVPQAFRNAGADAATGALLALAHRRRTGAGQHVSVSAQISVAQTTVGKILAGAVDGGASGAWQQGESEPLEHVAPSKVDQSGSGSSTPSHRTKWRVRDGFIETHLAMGPPGGRTNNMWAWLRKHGADGDLEVLDWRQVPDSLQSGALTMDDLEPYRTCLATLLSKLTKAEVLAAAMEEGFLAAPVMDISDIVDSPHHAAHDFWIRPGSGTPREVLLPGPFARVSAAAFSESSAPAPHLGEHTRDVLSDWLGLDPAQIDHLFEVGAVV